MFGRIKLSIFFAGTLIATFGCAKPNYENITMVYSGAGLGSEKITDCQTKFQHSGNCLIWSWEVLPTSSQAGALTFKIVRPNILDDSAVPVDPDFAPSLLLWMPGMGHGSSPTKVERVDVGTFRATNVFFVMPGAWQLKFQIKNGQALVDEVVVDINI